MSHIFAAAVSAETPRSGEATLALKKSFAWILRAGFALIVMLGFWYLLLLNSVATRGFVLQEIKNERQDIRKEVEKWDIALTIPTSLYALGSAEQVQEMVAASDPIFLEVRAGQVAFQN
ncbi:hypothetical protein HN954_02160 [bacterium]|jgi:hypothetical protein|nr:hypothetical protein [bacterium]MBT6832275.1 hypothetical protein [bacterium]MBT6996212.1 hypothetical protein [bacterium]MBT7772459.1 hypothetical protein [bacterium]